MIFCAGVVLAGLAPSMPLFVAGRLVHGYGGGVLGVALYVVIAQAYPEAMRPRLFAILTMAWVLPALVGPLFAAQVADAFGWRWVFLGVPVLAVASWLLVADAPSRPGKAEAQRGRLQWRSSPPEAHSASAWPASRWSRGGRPSCLSAWSPSWWPASDSCPSVRGAWAPAFPPSSGPGQPSARPSPQPRSTFRCCWCSNAGSP
ncbi:MFS transporter [Nocardioides alcanivorans]|uniref:MFS transporter n=1 Tax=Nocardioides alcanivorans TaxID=2897352 RepID=UPI001F1CAEEC|nr:MFS transporter [Nocardioides alcanivorans]